jgi:hypothetical protein
VSRELLAVASTLHLMKMKTLAPRIPVRSGVSEAAQVQKLLSSLPTSFFVNMLTKGEKED